MLQGNKRTFMLLQASGTNYIPTCSSRRSLYHQRIVDVQNDDNVQAAWSRRLFFGRLRILDYHRFPGKKSFENQTPAVFAVVIGDYSRCDRVRIYNLRQTNSTICFPHFFCIYPQAKIFYPLNRKMFSRLLSPCTIKVKRQATKNVSWGFCCTNEIC